MEKVTGIRVAIQGEPGSNSHMAARSLFGDALSLVPCTSAQDVFECLAAGGAERAVLPIENSLHGAVFEHYDLLLDAPVHITGELLLRIRHNVMAAPGVRLEQVRQIGSHPVALSQCRHWLRTHPGLAVVPVYDTAGSVKQLMASGARDVAGIAPLLAAEVYGAAVLVEGIEDHAENYTRFFVLEPGDAPPETGNADKMSLAMTLEHAPGTLLAALQVFADAGVNLTKIESRPVPGRPWEYVFFVDVGFTRGGAVAALLHVLRGQSTMLRVLGVYAAAGEIVR